MTALRSLAVRISAAVVRWASPGRKEWAEGLARELAFIRTTGLRWVGRLGVRECCWIGERPRPARVRSFPRDHATLM